MISLEEWVDVVTLRKQGLSIRAISRRLGVSRNTVRRTLRRGGPPKYVRPPRPSKLDPYKDYLLSRLVEFPELSAAQLFEEIRALGYPGGLRILQQFTRPHRVRRREPVVRFETPPGRQAQVDWAHLGTHAIEGKETKLYLFVAVLGFSRATYAEITSCQDEHAFLSAHARAFEFFGGVPAEVLYDNAKVVVLSPKGPRYNPALLDFAGRYGFSPRLCRPYRARTKGKVERTIGYIRDRFFAGRTFRDLTDANDQLLAWLEGSANVRIHRTTGERPADRLKRENLSCLPRARFAAKSPPPNISNKPAFRFSAPVVEVRSLSVYEEVCS